VTSNNLARTNNQSISRVIEVIRIHREVSRRLIAKETGLSTPSITRLVNELISAGILSVGESSEGEGAGPGRPASVVKLEPNYCCVIGVDVGEHVTQTAIGDMSGTIKHSSQTPLNAEVGGTVALTSILNAINEIRDLYAATFSDEVPPLKAITVGVPGTVDPKSFRVVKAPLVNGWTDFDLKEQLEAKIPDVSIRIVNDINAAAIGESALGVAKGFDDFVFVSVRRGIGAGIFINGKLFQGHAGFAGELGKMVFDPDFKYSDVKGMGHLETLYGEAPMLEQAIERGVKFETSDSSKPRLRTLSLAAANGDANAIEILKMALKNYGVAIANIASLLAPSIIVVGGDIDPVMEMTVAELTKTIGHLIPSPPKIAGSTLGEQAVLQGTFYQAHKDACDLMLSGETVQ
jgi:predicted NBD/HSP70 family sugar kinase